MAHRARAAGHRSRPLAQCYLLYRHCRSRKCRLGTSLRYAANPTDTATRRIVNTHGISLPQSLASTTLTVTGLDDLRPRRQYRTTSGGNYLVPGDLQTIYDARALISGGTNGAGVTIVVTGQAAIDTSYVITFRSLSNLPAKTITVKTYGTPLTSSGDVTEAYADVEWAGALEPSADIVFATSDNVYTSLQNAVDNFWLAVMPHV